ncbi:MAG: hypothetical protein ABL983_17305, partial [Nitrospira sp.]
MKSIRAYPKAVLNQVGGHPGSAILDSSDVANKDETCSLPVLRFTLSLAESKRASRDTSDEERAAEALMNNAGY